MIKLFKMEVSKQASQVFNEYNATRHWSLMSDEMSPMTILKPVKKMPLKCKPVKCDKIQYMISWGVKLNKGSNSNKQVGIFSLFHFGSRIGVRTKKILNTVRQHPHLVVLLMVLQKLWSCEGYLQHLHHQTELTRHAFSTFKSAYSFYRLLVPVTVRCHF